MKRAHLLVCLSLMFGPMFARAGEVVQYEIDAKFVACPSNAVAPPDPFDPSALPTSYTVVSGPRVTTVSGATAVLAILKDPPQFFERKSNGSYRLLQMGAPYKTGITLRITTTTVSSNENVKVDYQVTFCSILKREPLPGVSLDVGLPTMNSFESHSSLETKPNGWCLISLPGFIYPGYNNVGQGMLLMLRVRRVNSRGQPIDANGQLLAE